MDEAEYKKRTSEFQGAVIAYREKARDSFLTFISGLTIKGAHGPRVFSAVMTEFQEDCFYDLSSTVQSLIDGAKPAKRRFWIERTKKAGKDSDIAAVLLWLVAFSGRSLYMQVGAADRDQAAIVKRRINDLLLLNPWLNDFVVIQQYKIKSTNGLAELDILAADVAGSHGETPDLLFVNELSHVTKWEYIENLLDNAAGVPRGVIIVATNAGFRGTKAEMLRNAAEEDGWAMHIWSQPAPWISEEDLRESKLRSTRSRYRRLWKGVWASGKGDALDDDDLRKCFRLSGPLDHPEPGWIYIGGLDLGISHDHSGFAVVGIQVRQQRVRLVAFRRWSAGKAGEVDLTSVEDGVFALSRQFRLAWLGYDPYQAKLMSQRLMRRGAPMREMTFVGKNLTDMAQSLIQLVEEQKLELFDDQDHSIENDLGKFTIVEKPYGYKLEAVSDESGHADVGTALTICLPRALGMLTGRVGSYVDNGPIDDRPLTKDEELDLPNELKGIYEVYDDLAREAEAKKRGWDDD